MSSELKVSVAHRQGPLVVLAVVGELNLRTSSQLTEKAMALADDDHPQVILDLSQVPFCDSSGLNALIVLYRRLRAKDGTMALAAIPDRLERLLSLTGVNRMIANHPSIDEALAAHPRDGIPGSLGSEAG